MKDTDWKWDRVHDAVYEYAGVSLSDSDCKKVYDLLPIETQLCAEKYGWNDSVFGDGVCEFIEANKEQVLYIAAS